MRARTGAIALVLLFAGCLGVGAGERRFVRVTQSGGVGGLISETSIAETPAGTECLEEFRNPLRAQPEIRRRVRPAALFEQTLAHLKRLGLEQLSDYRQPGIEDAPTFRFEADLGERTIEFRVVGELKDLEDPRYLRILKALRDPEGLEPQP